MVDRVTMIRYWGLVNRELVGLARDLVEVEEVEARERQQRRQRRWWTRGWIARRPTLGLYDTLMQELEIEDAETFAYFMRMDVDTFNDLLQRVQGRIMRRNTAMRDAVSPGVKLAVTLRYLATGNTYRDLRCGFRVAHNTISCIVREVCQALLDIVGPEVLKTPTTADEWLQVAHNFQDRWQFPHTLGAIDGKHVAIKRPPKSGSIYYNYKGFYSIVLMALVDADYKFLWVQVGDVGSSSDGQIWNNCEMREAIEQGVLGVPDAAPLHGDDMATPYYLIADDAFGMRTFLMKPFSRRGLTRDEQIFNYRLSRARRVVENAFGIMANKFRCLLGPMQVEVDSATLIVKTCCVLHNYLRARNPAAGNQVADQEDAAHNLLPGEWRNHVNLTDMIEPQCGNRATKDAKRQRLYLKHYLLSAAGSVPWQDRLVPQHN